MSGRAVEFRGRALIETETPIAKGHLRDCLPKNVTDIWWKVCFRMNFMSLIAERRKSSQSVVTAPPKPLDLSSYQPLQSGCKPAVYRAIWEPYQGLKGLTSKEMDDGNRTCSNSCNRKESLLIVEILRTGTSETWETFWEKGIHEVDVVEAQSPVGASGREALQNGGERRKGREVCEADVVKLETNLWEKLVWIKPLGSRQSVEVNQVCSEELSNLGGSPGGSPG
ncbi:hypothetical protein K435DRAFT_812982 [Dendrothele bispora CBS 962.96]|uniref:Uncharacterized protein n=1 Tax=Dendrothele bispora (strain CBS 962.96) TaxID=1314807 RepID=A0A4S8KMS9_DENBC|nr:hypothetical protein K435DRAFT_812982 [Dendrothele bispora CBS 962.96]